MWRPGQNEFFDIRLNVNANSKKHQAVENILKKHEKEKKRAYFISGIRQALVLTISDIMTFSLTIKMTLLPLN